MADMITWELFSDLRGVEVRSADGKRVGRVNALFCSDLTDEPEWIGLETGLLNRKEAVVPVHGARVVGRRIVVPYDKGVIKRAPLLEERNWTITPELERRLCVYFSLTGHRPPPNRLTRYDFMRTNLS